MLGFCWTYLNNYLLSAVKKKNWSEIAGLLIIMSTVGSSTLHACADMTGLKKECQEREWAQPEENKTGWKSIKINAGYSLSVSGKRFAWKAFQGKGKDHLLFSYCRKGEGTVSSLWGSKPDCQSKRRQTSPTGAKSIMEFEGGHMDCCTQRRLTGDTWG